MLALDKVKVKLSNVQIPDGCITEIQVMEEGETASFPGFPVGIVPAHVRISVVCKPEARSHIRIAVWLPLDGWNGDLVGLGNGGSAGYIAPFLLAMPVQLGFATAMTDMGTSAGPDCGIGNEAVWKDFGYRATHLMTMAAKVLVEAFYGMPPRYSYFSGSSTGGQQALMEAQRYPEDYDGILCSAPAYDRTNLHIGFVWDWLALNDSEKSRFTAEDAQRATKAILEKCGEEGQRHNGDDFMYRPDKIRVTREVFDDSGLSEAQIDALMKIYSGPLNPKSGEVIHVPLVVPGSEAVDMGLVHRCDEVGFAEGLFYLFRWIFGADFDFKKFDFDKDTERIHQHLDEYLNATDPDLAKYRDRGGKLLLIHGTADPIIPCTSSIRYYELVRNKMDNVDSFFRLFLAPGMGHTAGGPGVQDIVVGFPATPKDEKHHGILALKAWVEEGKAPECLCPVAFRDNNTANGFVSDGVSYEREIYPYRE